MGRAAKEIEQHRAKMSMLGQQRYTQSTCKLIRQAVLTRDNDMLRGLLWRRIRGSKAQQELVDFALGFLCWSLGTHPSQTAHPITVHAHTPNKHTNNT